MSISILVVLFVTIVAAGLILTIWLGAYATVKLEQYLKTPQGQLKFWASQGFLPPSNISLPLKPHIIVLHWISVAWLVSYAVFYFWG